MIGVACRDARRRGDVFERRCGNRRGREDRRHHLGRKLGEHFAGEILVQSRRGHVLQPVDELFDRRVVLRESR